VTTELEAVRAAYRVEFGRYERLAKWVAARIEREVKAAGIYASQVNPRPKDVISFVLKAIRSGYTDPMTQITDKAGVRVILPLLADVPGVEAVVSESFEVLEHQDKGAQLDPDRLGYLGVHFLVTPRRQDLDGGTMDLDGAICEVQIHTIAQNAWASVSHPFLYKPPGGEDPPDAVRRRINRLVALVELFDSEFEASRRAIVSEPGYRQTAMLQPLEREFIQLADRDFDAALSLEVLAAIAPAYDDSELERFPALIAEFVAARRDKLEAIYESNKADDTANPLLFQPEAIAVLERLETGPERLRYAWDQVLPASLLTSLSEALGRPV